MQFTAQGKKYDDTDTLDNDDLICYCIEVDKKTIVTAIQNGAETLKEIRERTGACTGSDCKTLNPNKRCCSKEIDQLLKSNRGNTMKKNVFKTADGVKITFTGAVGKQNIVKMVENCQTGQCECMSDETKAKIKGMDVSGFDGDVSLDLSGEVSKEEIQAALSKSKVIFGN